MGSDWTFTTIEALKADSKGSIAIGPFGSRMKSDCYVESGIPVIRGTNITGGPNFKGEFVFITEEKADTLGSSNVYQGDLVFPHRGSIGEVGLLLNDKRFVLSSSLMKLTCDKKKALPKYLYYYFKSHIGRHELLKNASQVGTPGIGQPLTSLKSIELSLPPLPEQKAIAHILGSLDDKIELNRRMNATLEGMAQALFKSWFVDFDPVIDNALAAGNPIPAELAPRAEVRRQALADGTANREAAKPFPAAFQETESMGWIPKGWKTTALKDCTTKIGSGATPRGGSSAYIDEGTRLVRSQNIHDSSFRWNGIVCITEEAAEKLKGVTLEENDVLINITGDSILRTCIVDPTVLPARVNQHVAILRPKPNLPSSYLHQHIVRDEYKTYLMGFDAGGSRQAITKGHLEESEILLPNQETLKQFNASAEGFLRKQNQNNQASKTLTKLRDTLLPKLISGELQIQEAKKVSTP